MPSSAFPEAEEGPADEALDSLIDALGLTSKRGMARRTIVHKTHCKVAGKWNIEFCYLSADRTTALPLKETKSSSAQTTPMDITRDAVTQTEEEAKVGVDCETQTLSMKTAEHSTQTEQKKTASLETQTIEVSLADVETQAQPDSADMASQFDKPSVAEAQTDALEMKEVYAQTAPPPPPPIMYEASTQVGKPPPSLSDMVTQTYAPSFADANTMATPEMEAIDTQTEKPSVADVQTEPVQVVETSSQASPALRETAMQVQPSAREVEIQTDEKKPPEMFETSVQASPTVQESGIGVLSVQSGSVRQSWARPGPNLIL